MRSAAVGSPRVAAGRRSRPDLPYDLPYDLARDLARDLGRARFEAPDPSTEEERALIELTKGQDLALSEAGGGPLTRLRVGLGWDKERTAGFIGTGAPEVDLDASAVELAGEELFDLAFYNHLETRDGAVRHLGDNQSGRGEGDDEAITVDLSKVYPRVDSIVLLVTSYQGHTLEWIDNARCRLSTEDGTELARLTLTAGIPETGVAMARLYRSGEGWRLCAIGEGIAARQPTDSVAALRRFL